MGKQLADERRDHEAVGLLIVVLYFADKEFLYLVRSN